MRSLFMSVSQWCPFPVDRFLANIFFCFIVLPRVRLYWPLLAYHYLHSLSIVRYTCVVMWQELRRELVFVVWNTIWHCRVDHKGWLFENTFNTFFEKYLRERRTVVTNAANMRPEDCGLYVFHYGLFGVYIVNSDNAVAGCPLRSSLIVQLGVCIVLYCFMETFVWVYVTFQ